MLGLGGGTLHRGGTGGQDIDLTFDTIYPEWLLSALILLVLDLELLLYTLSDINIYFLFSAFCVL